MASVLNTQHLDQTQAQFRQVEEENKALQHQHEEIKHRLKRYEKEKEQLRNAPSSQKWNLSRSSSAASDATSMHNWSYRSHQWNNSSALPLLAEENELLLHPATLPQPETTQGLLMPPLKEPPEPNEQSLLSSKTLLYPDVKSRLSFERYRHWNKYGSHAESHGPQNYNLLQLENFHMVRGLVYEIVDQFLETYKPADSDQTKFHLSRIQELRRFMTVETVSQLLMEELILEVTNQLTFDVGNNWWQLANHIQTKSESTVARIMQIAIGERRHLTGIDNSANHDDQIYRKCKTALMLDRQTRSTSWSHILPLMTLPREFDLSAID